MAIRWQSSDHEHSYVAEAKNQLSKLIDRASKDEGLSSSSPAAAGRSSS
jgi:hypothetical protein